MCDRDEKDMIEINLDAVDHPTPKHFNYFGNIRFAKFKADDFAYKEQKSEAEIRPKKVFESAGKYTSFDSVAFVHDKKCRSNTSNQMDVNSLRQMYCPDCQERLDAQSVQLDKFPHCCWPIFPFNLLKRSHMSYADKEQKIVCKKCGNKLGYWKIF